MEFFSLEGQDKWLYENVFGEKYIGTFVEAGVYDGHTGSNTLFFENLGWNGLCIEPNVHSFNVIKEKNQRKNIDNSLLFSFSNKKVKFYEWDGWSGILGNFETEILRGAKDPKTLSVEKNTIVWNNLITLGKIPTTIDLLSLDTEGSEFEILRTIDYETIPFRVILVETTHGLFKTQAIHYLLYTNGYLATNFRQGLDRVFIHSSFKDHIINQSIFNIDPKISCP
jgi:hypothetical protein